MSFRVAVRSTAMLWAQKRKEEEDERSESPLDKHMYGGGEQRIVEVEVSS